MPDPLIAVASDCLEDVVNVISAAFQMEFESRDSSYWGDYWLARSPAEVQIYLNRDPLHDSENDPPEEFYFEPEYRDCGVLVITDDGPDGFNALANLLVRMFPESHVRR